MCLSIPARIIEIKDDMALVSCGGTIFNAGLQLVTDVREGDYVLLHAGFAISRISESEALETLELIRQMTETKEEDND